MTSAEPAAYLDPDRPIAERVQDLLARLTLAEKIDQMTNDAAAIPRLGIPAYNWWSEGLHGVANNGRATVFPQAIGMAATWDPPLIRRIASAVGDEARAKYHDTLRRNGESGLFQGLTIWSPNVNIFRDPRWGRGQETWGEDPCLTGEMGAAFVRGLQGDNPRYLKAAACAKHFAVHSGPEGERHGFDAQVSPRDLYTTYLPAFEKLVTEAGVEAVMGAYNRVNGEPCCASHLLLGTVLRERWNFQGHVVSDCGALDDIYGQHHVADDAAAAAALALKAGCDLCCLGTYEHLGEAVERGLADEADIDRALAHTLGTRFRLGMFDPPAQVPYAATPMNVVRCDAHRDLAYEAAVKSIVLLQNRNHTLPISRQVRTICVAGPCAGNIDVLLGNYHGISDSLTTLVEGIVARAPEGVLVEYRHGTPLVGPLDEGITWAFSALERSDLTIVGLGLSPLLEGEEGSAMYARRRAGDRAEIELPEVQTAYVKAMCRRGVKVVLVLFGGSPVALGEIADLVEAIVYVWYPGQEGGRAIADVLFGDVAPAGKLPVTFPQSTAQLPPFRDYSMRGRTYRYMTAEPAYPFGFGLSYTRFAYTALDTGHATIAAGESLPVSLIVANQGAVTAEEVVQFYISDLEASVEAPRHSLIGFQRVRLAPGQQQELKFTVKPEMLALVDDAGQRRLEPGEFRLTVGGCSPSPHGVTLGAPEPVSAVFRVRA